MTVSVVGQNTNSRMETYFSGLKNKVTKSSGTVEAKISEQGTEKNSLEERIIVIAKRDAANGVYMSSEYAQLEKEAVSECSPNRSAAISQVSSLMTSKKHSTTGGYPLIAILLGLPYKAEMSSGLHGNYASIYNEGGEMIASYHWKSGWTSVPTAAENACTDKLTEIYYNAYHEARIAIKSGTAESNVGRLDMKA